MARRSREERIADLERERQEIEAQLKRLKSIGVADQRKLDTRKKIIVGAVLLKELERNEGLRTWFMGELLPQEVKASRDRAVFGLPPLEPGV
jgi:hypothetical protein